MSKKLDQEFSGSEEEAFEMIELAAEELELLAKAFDVIAGVCEELDAPEIQLGAPAERYIH